MPRRRLSAVASSPTQADIDHNEVRKLKKLGVALASALSLVLVPINASAGGNSSTLQQDVNVLHGAGPSSVVAQSVVHGVVTNAVAGTAELGTSTPVSKDTHFRAGSVTKTFVAATLLQLVGEGRLSLDDTVDRWLPGVVSGNGNDGTKITVRQLLQHTSGLFNYTFDDRFVATIETAEGFYAHQYDQYTPRDLIDLALSHPPSFDPGTSWEYSNTNYVLAGQVIQKVTGNPWYVEVDNRIIKPLGLRDTSYPGGTDTLPKPFAHAYNIWTSSPSNRVYSDTTEHDMSWAGAAGALISTTADENKFFSALLSGKVLPPAQLAQMKTTVELDSNNSYGLGIVYSKLNCGGVDGVWWHNGSSVGGFTWVGTTPDGSVSLAYDYPTSSITGSDTAFVSATSGAEEPLVRHVFCGASATRSTNISDGLTAMYGPRGNPVVR